MTETGLYPVVSDSQCIHNTEVMCRGVGEITGCRAGKTTMSKMDDKSKLLESCGLEEFPIPLLDEVEW
jgi:hypothetical protein